MIFLELILLFFIIIKEFIRGYFYYIDDKILGYCLLYKNNNFYVEISNALSDDKL